MNGGLKRVVGRRGGPGHPAAAPARLAVVCEHHEFWTEISALGRQGGLRLVGPFPTAEAPSRLADAHTGLAVIHCCSGDDRALQSARLLADRSPPLRSVLAMDAIDNSDFTQVAFCGVSAVLARPLSLPELLAAIQAATYRGLYLAPSIAGLLCQSKTPPGVGCCADTKLTPREIEILHLEATGFLYKEIADKLSLSEHTVNNHLYAVRQKLGVHTAIEAIHLVFCAGCRKLGPMRPEGGAPAPR